MTLGDSLNGFYWDRQMGTSATKPGLEGLELDSNIIRKDGHFKVPYIEAQIMGGVSLDDIDYVVIHSAWQLKRDAEAERAESDNHDTFLERLDRAFGKRGVKVVYSDSR
jgi:hypothetical protein